MFYVNKISHDSALQFALVVQLCNPILTLNTTLILTLIQTLNQVLTLLLSVVNPNLILGLKI